MSRGSYSCAAWVAEKPYTCVKTGEIAGGLPGVPLPDINCVLARLKACKGNLDKVYLGASAEVSLPDGTTDETTGFELAPGEDTGWIPIENLSRLFCLSATGEAMTYMALCR